jgi:hypothetical protein
MFGARLVELRVVLKFEQKFEHAAHSEFLVQAASRRSFHTFHAARMTATAVGPVEGPEALPGRTLLYEELAPAIKNEQ